MSLTPILFVFNSIYCIDISENGKSGSLYYISHCIVFISLCETLLIFLK